MTKGQITSLYYFYEKEKIQDLEIMAKLHGAKSKKGGITSTEEGTEREIVDDLVMFKDPKDYVGLSKEQKKALTQQMKERHKGIQFLGGGDG